MEPIIFQGFEKSDVRGTVEFFNEVNLNDYKRFYNVKNFQKNQIRAWHGHKLESKLAYVIEGFVQFSVVKIDDWNSPNKDLTTKSFFLKDSQHSILFIPPGYANGFRSISENTSILFFSDKSLEDSLADDFRFPFDYWNPWQNLNY